MTDENGQSGFTLVEFAIAILIIGFLIVGVLKAAELVGNAQVVSTINQISQIETASAMFQSKYRQMAGDIINPGERIPNCTEAPCTLSGDGDGYLDLSSDLIDNLIWGSAGHESRNYWVHLVAAGLLRGVQVSYEGSPNKFGVDFPKTPMGGGWLVQSFRDGSSRRTYMTPVKQVTAFADEHSRLLTPARAYQIDLKTDDGLANRGKVRSYFSATNGRCTEEGVAENLRNNYRVTESENEECNMIILLSRAMMQ